jgi:hypothetical protein
MEAASGGGKPLETSYFVPGVPGVPGVRVFSAFEAKIARYFSNHPL